MDRIKLFILDADREDRSEMADMLSQVEYLIVAGEADTCENAVGQLQENKIDVILIGSKVDDDGYKAAEKILAEYPDLAVVMVETEIREDTVYKALFIGAKDIIVRPFTAARLVNVIYRVHQLMQKKTMIHSSKQNHDKVKSNLGQVITVFSTKGGVGRTFVSANLAVALIKSTKKRVVLVDLDLDFGDTALVLDIIPKYTISDVVDDIRNIDPDVIESYLVSHESGIKVLAANAKPKISEFINSEHVDIILKTLQKSYDYVIVDMPARFYETINPAFATADNLLLITTPEISTVRNLKASLTTLNDLNYSKSKIKVLLNKADKKLEIKQKDIENTLKMNIFATIEADYKLVPSSLNQGVPFIVKYPKSSVSKDILNLADKLAADLKRA